MVYYKRKRSYSAPGMSKKRRFVRRRRPVYRKRPFKRRYSRKGIRSAKATAQIPKTIMMKQPAMPDRLFTTFNWRTTGSLTSGAGGSAVWRDYLLNGLGIIDASSATPDEHYPRYVNQWLNSKFYLAYRVYAVTVEVIMRGTNADQDALMLVHQNDTVGALGPITPTVAWQNAELPDFTTRVINGTEDGGQGNIARFQARYKLANVFGVKKGAIYSSDDYEGRVDSFDTINRPNDRQYLHVGTCVHPAAVVSPVDVHYEVFFKFHAVLSNNANAAPVGADPNP